MYGFYQTLSSLRKGRDPRLAQTMVLTAQTMDLTALLIRGKSASLCLTVLLVNKKNQKVVLTRDRTLAHHTATAVCIHFENLPSDKR